MTATPSTVTLAEAKYAAAPAETAAPIVLDFGKHRRKDVKKLRQGSGKLMDEVRAAIEELRSAGAVASGAHPVIIIVQQKRRRTRGLLPSL